MAFVKGTSGSLPSMYSSEKLQELLKLVINAMKIHTCYDDDDDLEIKDQANVSVKKF